MKISVNPANLADYLCSIRQNNIDYISPKGVSAYRNAKGSTGHAYTIINITIHGEPSVAIYINDGIPFFSSGEELATRPLDKYYSDKSVAKRISDSLIDKDFHLIPNKKDAPWATFVGAYRIGQEIPELLGIQDVADELDWSPNKVSTYYLRGGKFPCPATHVGGRPCWTRAQIDSYKNTIGSRRGAV